MIAIEIVSKIEALKEWEALAEEATAEIEALKDNDSSSVVHVLHYV